MAGWTAADKQQRRGLFRLAHDVFRLVSFVRCQRALPIGMAHQRARSPSRPSTPDCEPEKWAQYGKDGPAMNPLKLIPS